MKITKTKADEKTEAQDLESDPTLLFLANIDAYKFNIGDILIKKRQNWVDEDEQKTFETETDDIGAPVKYVYAFENKLGIGYIKKLKSDGKGPTNARPTCIIKVVQRNEILQLDPDYAEHLLLSSEEKFKYNARYERIKAFRDEAIKKNEAIIIACQEKKTRKNSANWDGYDNNPMTKAFEKFWGTLKVGNTVYVGEYCIEETGQTRLEVIAVRKNGSIKFKVLRDDDGWRDINEEFLSSKKDFADMYSYVTTSKPYLLTEDNI